MSTLTLANAIVSLIVIACILLQERATATGGAFGNSFGGIYERRRGFERLLFGATVVAIVAFVILSTLNLVR